MKIRILGCGPSQGIPSISRGFGLCDENNPKNIRTRTSALIYTNDNQNILIDTSPEIRIQLLRAGMPKIDAILYTHAHYDHMGGANDLYAWAMDKKITLPIYLTLQDAERFKQQIQAAYDMTKNYFQMQWDSTIGGDDYFHCKANYEATKRGEAGEEFDVDDEITVYYNEFPLLTQKQQCYNFP